MGRINISQQHLVSNEDTLKPFDCDTASDSLVLAFGSLNQLEDPNLGKRLHDCCPGAMLAGCTTAGEITESEVLDDTLIVTALEFQSTTLRTHRVRVENMEYSFKTGEELAGALVDENLAYLMILSDGLAVNGSALVSGIRGTLPSHIPFSGGLAGDGAGGCGDVGCGDIGCGDVGCGGGCGCCRTSGFIAGGAIMGVVAALINFIGKDYLVGPQWSLNAAVHLEHWTESPPAEMLGFLMFALLCGYMVWDILRKR